MSAPLSSLIRDSPIGFIRELYSVFTVPLITGIAFIIMGSVISRSAGISVMYFMFIPAVIGSLAYLLQFGCFDKIFLDFKQLDQPSRVAMFVCCASIAMLIGSIFVQDRKKAANADLPSKRSRFEICKLPCPREEARKLIESQSPEKLADDKHLFNLLFDLILSSILNEFTHPDGRFHNLRHIAPRIEQIIRYNVLGGKCNRGISTLTSYRLYHTGNAAATTNGMIDSIVVGWCLEILQAFFLVSDDIMDLSSVRRDRPCWYRTPLIGLSAINDAFLLESFVTSVLRHWIEGDEELVKMFQLIVLMTEVGQELDLTSHEKAIQYIDDNTTTNNNIPSSLESFKSTFNLDYYLSIIDYKTCFYSFTLPILAGHYIYNKNNHYNMDEYDEKVIYDLSVIMGRLFQMHDDYMDAFTDPLILGKVGTDVQDNKCGWLAVTYLSVASEKDKEVWARNYGVHDDEAVRVVKGLYKKYDMEGRFHAVEEEYKVAFEKMIKQECDKNSKFPKAVFEAFWQKIYKRKK